MTATLSPPRLVGTGAPVPLVQGGETTYVNLDYAASAPALREVADHVAALLPLALLRGGTDVGTTLAVLAAGSSVGMTLAGGLLVREVRSVWGRSAVRGATRAGAGVLAGALVALVLR